MRGTKKNITPSISRRGVLDEVARKSGYTGAKMVVGEKETDPFDRILVVDEDDDELISFFNECRAELCESFYESMVSEGLQPDGDTYAITLSVGAVFNDAMLPSVNICLFNYFVYGILYRWYMYTNKEESSAYAELASKNLDDVRSKCMAKVFERRMHPF